MFFTIEYDYNTGTWVAEPCEQWLYLYPLQNCGDRKIYLGF